MVKLDASLDTLANEAAELIRVFFPNETVEINKPERSGEYSFFVECEWEENAWQTTILCGDRNIIRRKYVGGIREGEDEILYKRRVKAALKETTYYALKELTGESVPYGMLTGVRPLTLAHRRLQNNTPEEAIKFLQAEFDVSPSKARLLVETAEVQRTFCKDADCASLYIHIPFCSTRCNYCSFPSELISKAEPFLDQYMSALEKEARFIMDNAREKFESVYVGGGTPTSLPLKHFEKLMDICREAVLRFNINEFTVEAGRPDTIDKEKLILMKTAGVTRISVNPQTMNDETLERIGRRHTSLDIIKSFNLAREFDFDNINMDIIIGLTGENVSDAENTLERVMALDPDGITIHALARKHASELNRIGADIFSHTGEFGKLTERYYDIFRQRGYMPYYLYRQKYMFDGLENVGWCKPGRICVYNVRMMDDTGTCWAAGAGAISKRCYKGSTVIERRANPKAAYDYITGIDACINKKLEIMS